MWDLRLDLQSAPESYISRAHGTVAARRLQLHSASIGGRAAVSRATNCDRCAALRTTLSTYTVPNFRDHNTTNVLRQYASLVIHTSCGLQFKLVQGRSFYKFPASKKFGDADAEYVKRLRTFRIYDLLF